ncbi:MAG: glycosyltransferase [Flavobacteriales bacterium]|jgi:glycosyltransferase involved in cell wall biosynthesis|nr:glycosyltransferase [Flavobacteriales bacterium]
MHKKKIKIFLGGYLNYTNAQNLNCLALANYLDSSKFTTYALSVYFLPKIKSKAIVFNCFYPFKISSILGFLWGVIICDIAYFPKHKSHPFWIHYIAMFLGKKIFTTIENNMCDLEKESMINSFKGKKNLINYFKRIPNIFGITQYIIDNAKCGVKLENKVLYLGVESDIFSAKVRSKLKNIVFVGTLKKRKRVGEFLELAKIFPDINFNIIGDGIDKESLRINATDNVIFYGPLSQVELASKFNDMDLHILPSISEGFPKVILETASAGIPSLVYSNYGASEWIVSNENGFIVNDFEQLTTTLRGLINNENLLTRNSEGAILLAKKFNWKRVIGEWENVICNLR